MFCTLFDELYFIDDEIAADRFKDEITPSLKENDRIKFAQDMALNHVREKGKPRRNISYKLLKEEDGYYTLLGKSPYTTSIQLKYSLGGTHHCATVVGRWIFDSNVSFELPLTK